MAITLTINGKKQSVDAAPGTPLLWVLRDHLGLFWAIEERLYDGAVFGVLRRIGLDRQLAHRPGFLLGRDRHAEGRVGTIGLPILGRLADFGVA